MTRRIFSVLIAVLVLTTSCTGVDQDTRPRTNQSSSHAVITDNIVSGGVPQDGIPSIDNPVFIPANEADLDSGSIVFGVHKDGVAKAYPQRILVHHEIVNDNIAGENISVTYCPLTGTAIGYDRGNTTFGVSGKLVNNNLIMYDRATESYYPQILGEAISGQRSGDKLETVPVTWTTWQEWREQHPNTTVLSEDTGVLRDYSDDPYGSYNPISGYYEDGSPLFPVMNDDDRLSPKTIVLTYEQNGAAFATTKDALRSQRIISFTTGNTSHTMIYDESLDTGIVYNGNSSAITRNNDGYQYNGTTYTAQNIPLPAQDTIQAFWFAWAAFHPDTELHDT